MVPTVSRQVLIERAAAVGALFGPSTSGGDRVAFKRALTESHALLEDVARWLAHSHDRLRVLGHPPGLGSLPALTDQIQGHREALAALLPLLRFMEMAVELVAGPAPASARQAADGVLGAVRRVQRTLEETDIDGMERAARAAFDRAFASLYADQKSMAGLDEAVQAGEQDLQAGRVMTLDVLVTRLDGQ